MSLPLTIVRLPNTRPQIALPVDLAKVLKLIISSGARGITLPELTAFGSINPSQDIAVLGLYGARFSRDKKRYLEGSSSMIPHFSYLGWT